MAVQPGSVEPRVGCAPCIPTDCDCDVPVEPAAEQAPEDGA